MSGEVDFSFGSTISYMEPTRSGKVRAIAVTGVKRFAPLPEVPTVAESGAPGYNAVGWYGFYAPAGMPPDLVRRLPSETARAFDNPDIKERLERAGNELVMSSPRSCVLKSPSGRAWSRHRTCGLIDAIAAGIYPKSEK